MFKLLTIEGNGELKLVLRVCSFPCYSLTNRAQNKVSLCANEKNKLSTERTAQYIALEFKTSSIELYFKQNSRK